MPTDESARWAEFGRFLVERRDELEISRREAAKRSKVSESIWKVLETGQKDRTGGIRVLPNPTAQVLEAMAGALEIPMEELLKRVGRLPGDNTRKVVLARRPPPSEERADLARKLARLDDRDRRLVEGLIDSMLED